MEISDRRELDNLIAFSKSFRPNDLEPDFETQYTPPGQNHFLFDVPQCDENLELDDNEEQTIEQLFEIINAQKDVIQQQPQQSPEKQVLDELIVQEQQQPVEQVDMTEFNKVSPDVLNMLEKCSTRKSLFSESIKTKKVSMNGTPIKIYFFNSPKYVTLYVQKNTTVLDVLKQSISMYKDDPQMDHSLLKYPTYEAYEVRILDDDFDYRADMSFAALDKKKEILSTATNLFAIIEVAGYKPKVEEQMDQFIQQIKDKNMIILDITIEDQEQKSKLQMPIASTFLDVIDKLNKRNKKVLLFIQQINVKDYLIQLVTDDEQIELDFKMSIQGFEGKQIQVAKRKWADQSLAVQQTIPPESVQEIKDDQVHEAPLNDIQAFKYEKFTVIKINERGKKQDRILGIDQFRIYNMNKKDNLNFIEKIISNKETGTKYPERLIEDVVDLRVAHQFLFITFRDDKNDKDKFKELKFDTLDPKTAQKIMKKIQYIRENQIQQQQKKLRGYSQKFD